jgi:predicted double-glycine peptidase
MEHSSIEAKPNLQSSISSWHMKMKTHMVDPHQANGSLQTLQDPALDSPSPKKNLHLKPEVTQKNTSG